MSKSAASPRLLERRCLLFHLLTDEFVQERTCARCHSERTVEASHKRMPYWCTDCRSYFSVKVGTVMEPSKIPLHKWAIAFYQMVMNLKGVSAMKLHRDLGISYPAAWHLGSPTKEITCGR